MDIHFTENLVVHNKPIPNGKLIFFNREHKDSYNGEYVELVKNSNVVTKPDIRIRWFFKDQLGIEYRVKKFALNIIENSDGSNSATVNPEKVDRIMFIGTFERFLLNNGFDKNTEMTAEFIMDNIINTPFFILYEKELESVINIWNVRSVLKDKTNKYVALLIIDNNILGQVYCEIFNDVEAKEYLDENLIMYPNMKLYISRVDIRPDAQGKRLCKPLLKYMIKHLRRLGYEMLFIENASSTRKGVPACICYYRAGIENNYKMRYLDSKTQNFKIMNERDCLKKKIPRSYYYMSDNIVKRGKQKIKRAIKKFK